MNLLGLDTSSAVCAVCVARADGERFEALPDAGDLAGRPAHSRELLPAMRDCLDRAGLDWGELDAIAIGTGPGAFTGLRIGVASARALAFALGIELRPVPSLAALALGVEGADALAVIDARRGEVFTALYEGGAERWGAAAIAPEALAERLRESGSRPMAVGDGAVRFRDVLEAAGATVPPDDLHVHVVRGAAICELALGAAAAAPQAVLPEYIRPPDAKPSAP